MMMEPSISGNTCSATTDGSSLAVAYKRRSEMELTTSSTGTTTCPFLNPVPEELRLSYGDIPLWQQTILALGSTTVAFLSSSAGRNSYLTWTTKKVIKLILRVCLTALASTAVLQDTLYSPSRVVTSLLSEKGWLPSPLSRIVTIQPSKTLVKPAEDYVAISEQDGATRPIKVHYLLYEASKNTNANESFAFDYLHFNHGFGASSLSWLPVLPPLVHELSAKAGIAHDAIGFGFTDRPGPHLLKMYSFDTSAAIGLSLIMQNATETSMKRLTPRKVVLIGHSMGALATLRMARQLPQHINCSVMLVSPALITGKKEAKNLNKRDQTFDGTSDSSIITFNKKSITERDQMQILSPPIVALQQLLSKLQRLILYVPFKYILKRIVASKDAWRSGLQAAWGEPTLVSDDDVLRYRWPSLSKGWEEGLINFALARGQTSSAVEIQILSDVLQKPNVKVFIIHGTKDPVIPFQYSEDIVKVFPGIALKAMEGLGHNCFEEKPSDFVALVRQLLHN